MAKTLTLGTPAAAPEPGPALLRGNPFRRLLSASFLSYTTRWMENIATSWIVLQLTGSPFQVALLGFLRMAPMVALGLWAGVVSDRLHRGRLMRALQGLSAVSLASAAALFFTGHFRPWTAFLLTGVLGTCWALDWPARRSYLVDVAGGGRIVGAMSLDITALNIARTLGPLAAGLLLRFAPPGAIYAGMAAATLLATALVPLVRTTETVVVRPAGKALDNLRAGLGYVRAQPALVAVLLVTLAMNLFIFPYTSMVPVFAQNVLNVGAVGLGLLGAADGLGSLLGSLLLARADARRNGALIYWLSSLGMATGVFCFAASPLFGASLAVILLTGLSFSGFAVMQTTLVMLNTPEDMRGRALGVMVLAIGGMPIGILTLGALTGPLGVPGSVMLMGGLGLASIALLGWRFPYLRQRATPGG